MLLAHHTLPATAVRAGIRRALAAGSVDTALVVIEARCIAADRPAVVLPRATLARYDRPLPAIRHSDTLLAVAR